MRVGSWDVLSDDYSRVALVLLVVVVSVAVVSLMVLSYDKAG